MRFTSISCGLALLFVLGGCDAPSRHATPTPAATADARQPLAFTLEGSLPDFLKDGDEVKLYREHQARGPDGKIPPLATTTVKDGRFKLFGQVDAPDTAVLRLGKDGLYAQLVLEEANYSVKSTGPDVVVKGGTLNDLVFGFADTPRFIAAQKSRAAREEAAMRGVEKRNDAAKEAAMERLSRERETDEVTRIQQESDARILDGDSPPLAKLFVLNNNTDMVRYSFDKRMALLADLEKTLGPHPLVKALRERTASQQTAAKAQGEVIVGGQYKNVTGVDENGRKVQLSDVLKRSDLVLLDFWASWCSPCRQEMPRLAKLRGKYAGRLEIFAISLDENKEDWRKALKEERAKLAMDWVVLTDPDSKDPQSAKAYGVQGLPDNYLISRSGKILAKQVHGTELEALIAKELKAPAAH